MMGVSKNNGTPISSILIGFSIIHHPFWDTSIFGNIHDCGECKVKSFLKVHKRQKCHPHTTCVVFAKKKSRGETSKMFGMWVTGSPSFFRGPDTGSER